jgi:hypothetical protein
MLLLHVSNNGFAQLGAEAQVVNLVGESMGVLILEIVLQIVHMHVAVGEGLSRGNVEVSNDLVDLDATLQTTSLLALFVEVFGVVLSLALLDTLATTKRPRDRGISVADFVAGVTAVGLLSVGGSGCTVAFAAVIGGQMGGFIFVPSMCVSTYP